MLYVCSAPRHGHEHDARRDEGSLMLLRHHESLRLAYHPRVARQVMHDEGTLSKGITSISPSYSLAHGLRSRGTSSETKSV